MKQASRLGRLTQAEKTYRERLAETVKVFKDKAALFLGNFKVQKAIQEERKAEFDAEEQTPVTTTVDEKLAHFYDALGSYINDSVSVDAANQQIKVDVMVDGEAIFKQLPMATIVHMKQKVLPELHALFQNIPTTSTGIDWKPSESQRPGVLVSEVPQRFRSEKKKVHTVVVQPTEHFPAQFVSDTYDVNVATINERKFSGELTPVAKAERLAKLDKLIAAFTVAAGEGNSAPSPDVEIATSLFNYLR